MAGKIVRLATTKNKVAAAAQPTRAVATRAQLKAAEAKKRQDAEAKVVRIKAQQDRARAQAARMATGGPGRTGGSSGPRGPRKTIEFEVADDSLRDAPGGGAGRPVSALTQALLDGQTVVVPFGTSMPDKTIKARTEGAQRLRSKTHPDGVSGYVLWVEDVV